MAFNTWLRRIPEDELDEIFYFRFLGEAYVHEKMDGEAMEYQNTHGIPTRVFDLR